MEESDEGAAAAAAEAAFGFDPQLLINEVLNSIDDIRVEAFDYCLQEAAPKAIGAARAAEKAGDLERGINVIHRLVKNALDRRMNNWEKYCHHHCFTVPEGFVTNEDDNSCAKGSCKDGASDSDLDTELDSLRRKIQSANKESENLQRELSSLERKTTYKTKFDDSVAEIWKFYEDNSVQKSFEDLANAVPKLQQKLLSMKRRAEPGSSIHQQLWNSNCLGGNKRLAFDISFTANTEDVLEVVNLLQRE